MDFKTLYEKLSKYYPESLKCEWDNDGIMCADDVLTTVNKVLIALDVTKEVLIYAKENGFDTVISHHPLVFFKQNSINPENHTQEKLIYCIKNGIKVMSFHTRLDSAKGGVSETLAKTVGLENIQTDTLDCVGRIGILQNETSLDNFAKNVKEVLKSPFVIFNGNKNVKKVYVVGGDGKDLIPNAISNGCDTLLTGRASYNTTIDAKDIGLNIVEAGHFYTENPICEVLKAKINEIAPEIGTETYNSNQIKFI